MKITTALLNAILFAAAHDSRVPPTLRTLAHAEVVGNRCVLAAMGPAAYRRAVKAPAVTSLTETELTVCIEAAKGGIEWSLTAAQRREFDALTAPAHPPNKHHLARAIAKVMRDLKSAAALPLISVRRVVGRVVTLHARVERPGTCEVTFDDEFDVQLATDKGWSAAIAGALRSAGGVGS